MAKLNGVKTLDMVNGEITKVAYEGAEYVKVDGFVESTNDILLAIENGIDRTKGEFYRVIRVGSSVRWEDDTSTNVVGAEYIGDRFEVFRKISADKPTLEQRVETLESDVATLKREKVAGEPKRLTVGDVAKIIGKESGHFGEIGDIVMIIEDAKDAQPYRCKRVSDGKDVGWFYEEELVAYNEETIEFEGATYRKVEREAREGDVVVLTGDELPRWFTKGKAYKIIDGPYIGKCDEGYTNYKVYYAKYGRTRETVDVYELIEQAKYVPQEGDIVVVTDDSVSNHTLGDVGKITEVDGDTFRVTVPGKKNRSNWLMDFRFRKATPAEVEKYEQALQDANKPKLKAGDFVKFKRNISDTKAGKPYLIEYYEDEKELAFKDDAGDWCSIARTGEYEILSAEEVKWAKIGRKPNEFKKGDVVRVKKDGVGVKVGQVHEVYKHDRFGVGGGNVYFDKAENLIAVAEKLELIAPVESRFNA